MRLVFIHGINNEKYTMSDVRDIWMSALEMGWEDLGITPNKSFSVEAAYYADILASATNNENAIPMGKTDISSGLAIEFLRAYADEAGITQEELQTAARLEGIPQEAVAMAVPHEGWIIAFTQILERLLPTKGKYISKIFLRQAATYISNPALAEIIAQTIITQVFKDKSSPTIVVGHSLGSIVSYRLLASDNFYNRSFPLHVTLGSPLSVAIFRPILPKRGTFPNPPITRWINGRNREDFVTLGRAITKKSIGYDGVEDITDITDNKDDRHDIRAYLRSPKIAQSIYEAIQI